MLDSSQQLLYIILSICVLWFTLFLCWLLYQAARVLQNANRIIEDVMKKLELIVDAVHFIREKVDGLSSGMNAVTAYVSSLVGKAVVGSLSKTMASRSKKRKEKTTEETS